MENITFANFDNYIDMYAYVAEKPRGQDELLEHLNSLDSKTERTVTKNVEKAMAGSICLLTCSGGQVSFDAESFKRGIADLCERLGFTATIEPKTIRKTKTAEKVATVTDPHSPAVKKFKKEADDARARCKELESELLRKEEEITQLEKQLSEKTEEIIAAKMQQKILVTGSATFHPKDHFKRDFFLLTPDKLLDVEGLTSRYGGEVDSPYEAVFSNGRELTEDNYRKSVMQQLFGGCLLKNRLEEQERLPVVEKTEVMDGVWVKRDRISLTEIERNRFKSINRIIQMDGVSNQVKLALYAAWIGTDDPDRLDLLRTAGENGIEAGYVIRLLEAPVEYHNYRMLKEMLLQAKVASEERIKKDAAMELVCRQWYVEAEYDGKRTRFLMVPETELKEFKDALSEHNRERAKEAVARMLSGGRKEDTDPGETAAKTDAAVPDFVHEAEEACGADCHAPVDEDAAYADYAESAGGADGE